MADVKISGLPASTTPLAGTEVLPIVQGGITKQVSVNNLTTGKAVSATQYTSTIATGTAPLIVASTTEVANLRAANATSADTANQVKSNATTGVLQVAGPGTGTTRVMTTPDANFTAARTDAAQTFTGTQSINSDLLVGGAPGTVGGTRILEVFSNNVTRIESTSTGQFAVYNIGSGTGGTATAGYWLTDSVANTMVLMNNTNGPLILGSNSVERMRVFASGGVSIGNTTDPGATNLSVTGNVVMATSGKGIDFSATAGTGTSELLADYEEGTYTATMTPNTSGTITLNAAVNTMFYTKVGRLVTVTGLLQVSSVSSPVGTYVRINLPFASSGNAYAANFSGSVTLNDSSVFTVLPVIGLFNASEFRAIVDASTINLVEQFSISLTYVAA